MVMLKRSKTVEVTRDRRCRLRRLWLLWRLRPSLALPVGLVSLLTPLALGLSPAAAEDAPSAAPIRDRYALRADPLALSCLGCHAPDIESAPMATAASGTAANAVGLRDLSTLDVAELRDALRAWRAGDRPGTVMPRLAKGLTDDEIERLSRSFARR